MTDMKHAIDAANAVNGHATAAPPMPARIVDPKAVTAGSGAIAAAEAIGRYPATPAAATVAAALPNAASIATVTTPPPAAAPPPPPIAPAATAAGIASAATAAAQAIRPSPQAPPGAAHAPTPIAPAVSAPAPHVETRAGAGAVPSPQAAPVSAPTVAPAMAATAAARVSAAVPAVTKGVAPDPTTTMKPIATASAAYEKPAITAPAAADVILKVSNIESYYGPIMAIRGVSLEVPKGRIVTVLGANGAGKTTILKTISGVLDPLKGTVEFEGRPIQRMDADRIVRLGLSHVPEGREVFPFLTVAENLQMGAYLRHDRKGVADDLERIYEYFPRLKERLTQPAGHLSGGEQQMLAISRALMNRPKLLLLDEPSLGLSPLLVKEIFAIIRRVNAEQGTSILLVEQNARMALESAHFGYVLEVGRIVMADTCERLMQSKDIQEFYLGAKDESARGERRWKKKKTWR
jgi:branched-chain amino acid transport system ATP-binding protein